jgi:hypothetical protein
MGYWFFQWLDDQYVRTIQDAERVLAYPTVVEDLRQQALIASREKPQIQSLDTISVLAGRGLDLSGHIDCVAALCSRCQANHLFRHIWHYFDHIIVQDAVTDHLIRHWDCWGKPEQLDAHKEMLLPFIEIVLYLRQIGAEPLIQFHQKPSPCKAHWKKHAKEIGLDPILSLAQDLVPSLAKEAQVSFQGESNGHIFYTFIHPAFENDYIHIDLDIQLIRDKPEVEIQRIIADDVVGRFIAYLTTDVVTAQKLKSPLGATTRFHAKLLQASEELSATGVAFNIELPVLEGVPVQTLIKIRQDEQEYFKRFQYALRQAINERIKANQSANALHIANQIRQDVIEPELHQIRERLAASEKLLKKKTAVGIFLSTLTTTCGILAGAPPPLTVSGGLAPMITMAGQAATKYLEEKRDIELEDMYFLWKAVEHQH